MSSRLDAAANRIADGLIQLAVPRSDDTVVRVRLALVTIRPALATDEPAVVELLTAIPLRTTIEWALSPADGDRDVHERFHRWNVTALRATGTVVWDGSSAAAGGRPYRLGPLRKLRYGLARPRRTGQREGRFMLPDIPSDCQRRLMALSEAAMSLRPPGRTFLLQLWGSNGDPVVLQDAVCAVVAVASPARVVATTALDDDGGHLLQDLGFTELGTVPAGPEGRPALKGWATPAP